MRISVKVAPGVRISGRVGGRHHHRRRHHHHTTTWTRPRARSGDWLHRAPGWHMPLPRVDSIGDLIAFVILAEIGAIIWLYEVTIWMMVWMVIAIFVGTRAAARAIASRRSRHQGNAGLTSKPEYIDLGQLK